MAFLLQLEVQPCRLHDHVDPLVQQGQAAADVRPDDLGLLLQQLRRVRNRQRSDVQFCSHAASLSDLSPSICLHGGSA
jgi:hypothetical protein